jgi:hypothetical protein
MKITQAAIAHVKMLLKMNYCYIANFAAGHLFDGVLQRIVAEKSPTVWRT